MDLVSNSINFSGIRCLLLDWGDTVMRNFDYPGPMAEWPEVEVLPGVSETLDKLKDHYIIALGTNAADSNEQAIWDALGKGCIDVYFHKVYCFEKTKVRKPSPEFYQFILHDLDLKPSQIIFVSDSFEQDILSAGELGIPGLWLNENSDSVETGEKLSHDTQVFLFTFFI